MAIEEILTRLIKEEDTLRKRCFLQNYWKCVTPLPHGCRLLWPILPHLLWLNLPNGSLKSPPLSSADCRPTPIQCDWNKGSTSGNQPIFLTDDLFGFISEVFWLYRLTSTSISFIFLHAIVLRPCLDRSCSVMSKPRTRSPHWARA